MTRPAREPTPIDSTTPRSVIAARLAIPIALAVVGYAVLVAEQWSVDHELQLAAPEQIRAGDPIPMRAMVFGDIEHPDGGELVPARVDVELRSAERVLASTTLRASPTTTSEGELAPIGRDVAGELRLFAVARDEDGDVIATVDRPLRLDAAISPMPLSGRIGMPLQHLDLGPVTLEGAGGPIPPLDVRVAGGTCVPEEPCELWISAGDADAVTIEETPAASVAQRSSLEGALVQLVVVPHGPEVPIELLASRLGQPLARRPVRLPIALATPWLTAPRLVTGAPVTIEAHAPPGREVLIIDAFHDGHWVHTATIEPGQRELPFALLRPGLFLLQARSDPYGGERSAARYLLYSPPGSGVSFDDTRALLARAGIQLTDPESTDPRMLLAGAEEEVRTLPSAISGLEADRAQVTARRHRLHVIAAIALLLGIAVVLSTLLKRGLGAAAEAREVMLEAGAPDAASAGNRARMTIGVIAIVGAVAVALLAGAAIILARAAMVGW